MLNEKIKRQFCNRLFNNYQLCYFLLEILYFSILDFRSFISAVSTIVPTLNAKVLLVANISDNMNKKTPTRSFPDSENFIIPNPFIKYTFSERKKGHIAVTYADNFFLPFARLAAKTFLPPGVLILALNP